MMDKHTLGPLEARHDPEDDWHTYRIYEVGGEFPVANILGDNPALANLLGASFDLLAALEDLVDALEPHFNSVFDDRDPIGRSYLAAIEAIATAEPTA